ncbi:unnamed protein product, partial [Meganyctiphanes norvegica]
ESPQAHYPGSDNYLGSLFNPRLTIPMLTSMPTPSNTAVNAALPQRSSTVSSTNAPRGCSLKCIKCSYVSRDMTTLMEHLDSHFPVRTFLCVDCTMPFPGPRELQEHQYSGLCPFKDATKQELNSLPGVAKDNNVS